MAYLVKLIRAVDAHPGLVRYVRCKIVCLVWFSFHLNVYRRCFNVAAVSGVLICLRAVLGPYFICPFFPRRAVREDVLNVNAYVVVYRSFAHVVIRAHRYLQI